MATVYLWRSSLYTKINCLYSRGGFFVREFTIRFHSFRDVQDFVNLASAQEFPITVGNDSYSVSASSFMGMFTLDYSNDLKVKANCTDEQWLRFGPETKRFQAG